MKRHRGRDRTARRSGIALIAASLVVTGCAAKETPECAGAQREFAAAIPSLTGFHAASGDVLPAVVAGVALAVVERMPDDGWRKRCYDEIMAEKFADYPPYAAVR